MYANNGYPNDCRKFAMTLYYHKLTAAILTYFSCSYSTILYNYLAQAAVDSFEFLIKSKSTANADFSSNPE